MRFSFEELAILVTQLFFIDLMGLSSGMWGMPSKYDKQEGVFSKDDVIYAQPL